jgi:hypothetical protein
MAIQWGLAQTPDFVGQGLKYRQAGEQAGLEKERQSALRLYAQDPDAAVSRLMAVDPQTGMQFRQMRQQDEQITARKTAAQQYGAGDMAGASNTALAAGDFDLVKTFTDMTKDQRAEAARRAQLGTSIGLSLKNIPPEARQQQLQAMMPQLEAQGLTAEDIASIPLDDAGIEAGLGLAMSASEILGRMDKDRTFAAGREDETFRRDMEGQKFDWTRQVDGARLGNERARIGLEAQRVAMAGVGGMVARPLPPSILSMERQDLDNIAMSSQINARLTPYIKSLEAGNLKLGVFRNMTMQGQNLAGRSSAASREFGNFRADLEKMRNDSLRLNNGVQTEGDAQRAWNELMANLNDSALVADRLKRIQGYNEVAAQAKRAGIEDRRAQYGQAPPDFSRYEAPAAGAGGGGEGDTRPPPATDRPRGARQGANGKLYIADPNNPRSFPEARKAPDGNWYIKSANGQYLRVE